MSEQLEKMMSMDLNLNINAETVNEYLTKAILGSVIGKNIQEAITQVQYNYDKYKLDKVILEQIDIAVKRCVHEVIRDHFEGQIKEKIKTYIESQALDTLVKGAYDLMLRRIN